MKKILSLLLILLFVLISPIRVSAHGGVEKRAGNVLVTLFQTPLSPLVNEQVGFAYILTDLSESKRLVHKSARLVVTQTAYNDPSKDKIVYTKEVTSDVNGTINFSYTFPTTNYYDIDLQFGKPNDEVNTTGFLVQPRSLWNPLSQTLSVLLVISIIIIIVFISIVFIAKNKKQNSKS